MKERVINFEAPLSIIKNNGNCRDAICNQCPWLNDACYSALDTENPVKKRYERAVEYLLKKVGKQKLTEMLL
jgi:hypothetical protein